MKDLGWAVHLIYSVASSCVDHSLRLGECHLAETPAILFSQEEGTSSVRLCLREERARTKSVERSRVVSTVLARRIAVTAASNPPRTLPNLELGSST